MKPGLFFCVERGPVTISKGGQRQDRRHATDATDLTQATRLRPRHASPPHSGRRRGSGPGHRRPRRAGGGDPSGNHRNCERLQQQLAAGAALVRLAEHHCPARGRLDLGSIGKALAADLAAAEAMAAAGSGGFLVSLRGDIAVAGEPPEGGWPSNQGQTVSIIAGGGGVSSCITTSWTRPPGCRWRAPGARRPSTRPAAWTRTLPPPPRSCSAAGLSSMAGGKRPRRPPGRNRWKRHPLGPMAGRSAGRARNGFARWRWRMMTL
jgi:hypothetical protein